MTTPHPELKQICKAIRESCSGWIRCLASKRVDGDGEEITREYLMVQLDAAAELTGHLPIHSTLSDMVENFASSFKPEFPIE